MNKNKKQLLNHAIDEGNIVLADQLAAELVLEEIPAMPEDFAEKIQALAEEKKIPAYGKKHRKSIRKRPVILAAALVALLAFGTVAYAAGLLFPSVNFKDGTATTVNAPLESNEYKAASEYAVYLNRQQQQLGDSIVDPSSYPIYANTEKVKELSQKYGLKYATKRTDIMSLEQIPSVLKDYGIPDFLGTALSGAKAGQAILGDGETALTFNDGNFYLAYELPGSGHDIGDSQINVSYTPKGSFPWNGFCLAPGEGTDAYNQEQAFTYKTKNGLAFTCVPVMPKESGGLITEYACFGDIGDGYITIAVSHDISAAEKKKRRSEGKQLDRRYEEKAKSLLGINLEELQNRVVNQWNEAAWAKEPESMEKACLATTDPKEAAKLSAKLERKYSTATDAEKKLYKEWEEAGFTLNAKYKGDEPVSQDALAAVLETFSL